MTSRTPIQGLFSKLSNFAGTKIKKIIDMSSFQNEGQLLQELKHYLNILFETS
jgi:hypothetical protein